MRQPPAARVRVKIVAGIDILIEHVDGEAHVGSGFRLVLRSLARRGLVLGLLFLGKQSRHKHHGDRQHFQEITHEILESRFRVPEAEHTDPSYWTEADEKGQPNFWLRMSENFHV